MINEEQHEDQIESLTLFDSRQNPKKLNELLKKKWFQ